jgi:uncharacterized membrane protein
MNDYLFARLVHVLTVVLWIGGVAFVTTVLLPACGRLGQPDERIALFERVEAGFARQARITTLLAGLSGFYLAYRLDAWARFADPGYWWMHAMVLVWLVFALMLFVFEPLWLHRWLRTRVARDPDGTFSLVRRLHWLLLAMSLITVAGAAAGSHGWRLGA